MENLFVPEASTTVAEDGTFNFPSLGLARYEVRVTGLPRNSWVKKIQAGDQELPARVLDLSSGASAGPLSVQVKLTAGAVTGKALNNSGNSVSDATVVLVPSGDTPSFSLFQVTRSDGTGAFNFYSVPPGDYYMFAWDDIESGAYLDPEFRKRFGSAKAEVKVRESASLSMDLKVAAGR